jgi:hypothetical protein
MSNDASVPASGEVRNVPGRCVCQQHARTDDVDPGSSVTVDRIVDQGTARLDDHANVQVESDDVADQLTA